MNNIRTLSVFIAVFLMSGCSTLSYYTQAVKGHFALMNARQDIEELLQSPDTDTRLKEKLDLARQIRRFATESLGLPENDSYKSFVDTGRDYVTWNVVAAEEFSVKAKTWCFPVAGCVSYKGYFAEQDAHKLADELDRQGLDTIVNGATAYSTLGWFDDPVLNTMLKGSDIRLAALIFHELAHQKLYVKGDSEFNEAYASFVEQEGVRAWLKSRNQNESLNGYSLFLQRREDFSNLLTATRARLQNLYDSDSDPDTKRRQKLRIFAELKQHYLELKTSWNAYNGYDQWFEKDMNNARLVAVTTYRRLVPAFNEIFRREGADFTAFYQKTREISEMKKDDRDRYLDKLTH